MASAALCFEVRRDPGHRWEGAIQPRELTVYATRFGHQNPRSPQPGAIFPGTLLNPSGPKILIGHKHTSSVTPRDGCVRILHKSGVFIAFVNENKNHNCLSSCDREGGWMWDRCLWNAQGKLLKSGPCHTFLKGKLKKWESSARFISHPPLSSFLPPWPSRLHRVVSSSWTQLQF